MKDNQQQPKSKKTNKIKQVLAFMTTKEKKLLLIIFFSGAILMFIINVLKIVLK
jgi:hypothetical protein